MNSTQVGMHDEEGLLAKRLSWIEMFLLSTTYFVVIVAFSQFCRGNGLVSSTIKLVGWAGSAMIALLVSFIFGLIRDADLRNEFVPIWAVLLVFMYATVSCDYLNLKDRSNTGVVIVKFFIYIVYAVIMLIGTQPSLYIPLVFLLLSSCLQVVENVSAHIFISCANQLIRPDDDDAIEDDNDDDPFLRCKYAVYPGYPKFDAEDASKLITLQEIWGTENEEKLCHFKDPLQLQNRCLSVALFWKLFRKIVGIPTYQISHQSKEWKLIRNGLLQPATEKRCPFSVVEEELSVLYDFLHQNTGFFLYQFGWPWQIVSKFITAGPSLWIVAILCRKLVPEHAISFSFENVRRQKPLSTHQAYAFSTLSMATYLLLFQSLYCFRRSGTAWPQLHGLRRYLKRESWKSPNCGAKRFLRNAYLCSIKPESQAELLAKLLSTPLCRPFYPILIWLQNMKKTKLPQYSLLESFSSKQHFVWKFCSLMVYALSGLQIATPGRKQGEDTFLTEELKKAVRQSLLAYGPQLSNGIASLEASELPGGVKSKLTRACTQFKTDAEAVLVWHIATSICEISPGLSPQTRESDEFKVATTLSKYCAYLVALAPDLLPGNAGITNFTCRLAIEDVCAHLKDCEPLDSIYGKLIQIAEEVNFEYIETGGREKGTILQQAAVLGKVLEEEITETSKRWEILAKFWAEMILYLAPNENNEWAHVEKLAGGREFITVLWALLFHAGIVNRDCLRNKPLVTR